MILIAWFPLSCYFVVVFYLILATATGPPLIPPNPPAVRKAVFERPEKSASVIKNSYPDVYDVFGHVCRAGTYVPNSRIRDMLHYNPPQETVQYLADCFARGLQYADTYKPIADGSETMLIDPNLQFVLNCLVVNHGENRCAVTKLVTSGSVLCKNSHGEHCISTMPGRTKQKVLIGSEVKGVEASIEECYSQCTTVCGDAAFELLRSGLKLEDCVIPGFMMAGTVCQFCAVYLIHDMFPVMVALSNVLCTIGTIEEQREIAVWHLRLVDHAQRTVNLLGRVQAPLDMSLVPSLAQLNVEHMFLKPVRPVYKNRSGDNDACRTMSTRSAQLNHIMRMYELMRKSCPDLEPDSENTIVLFPVGVLSMPSESVKESKGIFELIKKVCVEEGFEENDLFFSPIIVFPLLRDWRVDKPPEKLHSSYMAELDKAIAFMNTGTIAHMDLRPANIMWQERDGNAVIMKIIDFELSVIFSHSICPEWIEIIVSTHDYRYPFRVGDEQRRQLAEERHNLFFGKAIQDWLNSPTERFGEFMLNNGQEIVEEIFQTANEKI